MYDFLIVGAGLYGATMAFEAKKRGFKCLVIERRAHTGGNIYCKKINGINVHYYGAHIFHTKNKKIWEFINQFTEFNNYINSPLALYKGKMYNLPFNMNTFYQLWNTVTPEEAKTIIDKQKNKYCFTEPQNLEEQALMMVGEDVYFKLIKGYTEKQWGQPATLIPAFVIKRLPVRFTFNNNYFDDPYQGIPIGGYNTIIDQLLNGTEVKVNTDYFTNRNELKNKAKKIIYTGEIDRFYDYQFGKLKYRSLKFEHEELKGIKNFQGNAVVNYTDKDVPYTRILEHKHFEFGNQPNTVITKEYPIDFTEETEPYYPVNDDFNNNLFEQYKHLANQNPNIHFGGRLGEYKYYNMDQVISRAFNDSTLLFN